MPSRAEERTSRNLRAVLAELPEGAHIPDSDQFREVLAGLEYYVTELISEVDLDGVIPLVAQKTGPAEVEIFGLCILIDDQSVTPLDVRLQLSPHGNSIAWIECRLGEQGENGMVRTPYASLDRASKRLRRLGCRADAIDWVHAVTFGERRF